MAGTGLSTLLAPSRRRPATWSAGASALLGAAGRGHLSRGCPVAMLCRMATPQAALDQAIACLVETLEHAGVGARFGSCSLADLQAVARELPMPAELWSLYSSAGPLDRIDIPAPLGAITFAAGRDLVPYQSGYRWHGNDKHRLEEWPDSWVVVADHSADPFVADTASPGTPVGVAIHGAGQWRPFWIAPTPTAFITLLACFTQAYVIEHLNHVDDDDDDQSGDESWPPAYHGRLASLLAEHAPEVDASAFLDYLSR